MCHQLCHVSKHRRQSELWCIGICKNPWLHSFPDYFILGGHGVLLHGKSCFFFKKRFFILCLIILFVADSFEVFCAINCSMAPISVQPQPITEHQAQPQAQAQPQLPTDQLRQPQQPRPQSQPQVELQLTSAPPLPLAPQPTAPPTSWEMPRQPVATPGDVDVLTRDNSILDLDLTHPQDEAVSLAQLATLSTVPPNGVFDQPPPDDTNAGPPQTQTSFVSTPNVINVGLSAEVRPQRERPNFLECAVCFEVFDEHDKKPMILPCGQGHTICAACDALIEPEQWETPLEGGGIRINGPARRCPVDRAVLETLSQCNRIMLDVLQHWLRRGSNAGRLCATSLPSWTRRMCTLRSHKILLSAACYGLTRVIRRGMPLFSMCSSIGRRRVLLVFGGIHQKLMTLT